MDVIIPTNLVCVLYDPAIPTLSFNLFNCFYIINLLIFIICTHVDEVVCLGCFSVLWIIIIVLIGALASIPLIVFGK